MPSRADVATSGSLVASSNSVTFSRDQSANKRPLREPLQLQLGRFVLATGTHRRLRQASLIQVLTNPPTLAPTLYVHGCASYRLETPSRPGKPGKNTVHSASTRGPQFESSIATVGDVRGPLPKRIPLRRHDQGKPRPLRYGQVTRSWGEHSSTVASRQILSARDCSPDSGKS